MSPSIARITIGQRGHYKPWLTQLSTGELLMVARCDPVLVAANGTDTKEPNCTAKGGVGPFAAVLWRAQVRSYFLVFVPAIREIRDFYREM
eukprot:SAG31_NODE_3862_length_3810_cov_32.413096_4_plen_91_part_00